MKVFISWSGKESQNVAGILKKWIPCIIQNVEPYFSSSDIDKGARWSTDIAKELQDASFGILCVTKDNLSSGWLNFEAGALSRSIEQSKVCPFLINMKPSEIQNSPILQFQMTTSAKEDVFKLFNSINANLGDKSLQENILQTTFEMFWPKINEDLQKITPSDNTKDESQVNIKSNQIDEILELVRYQHKILNNPNELLPPDYLMQIIRENERYLHKKSVVRNSSIEILDLAKNINHILSICSNECELSINNIDKARVLSEKLLMIIKHSEFNNCY